MIANMQSKEGWIDKIEGPTSRERKILNSSQI